MIYTTHYTHTHMGYTHAHMGYTHAHMAYTHAHMGYTHTHTHVHTLVVRTQLHEDSQTFHPIHHDPYKKDDWIYNLKV